MSSKVPFGSADVKKNAKAGLVQDVFNRVSERYDLMNDLMSAGIHRVWRQKMMQNLIPHHPQKLLDVAGGTGDIARRALVAGCRDVTVADPNRSMMEVGKGRLLDKGISHEVSWVEACAENLPFADHSFDTCTIAFGLRNVVDVEKSLQEMLRVLMVGGKFLCLEFSRADSTLIRKSLAAYNRRVLPLLGRLVLQDENPYQYLAESIERFHTKEEIKQMMGTTGYRDVSYLSMSGGLVALHIGWKL